MWYSDGTLGTHGHTHGTHGTHQEAWLESSPPPYSAPCTTCPAAPRDSKRQMT